MWVVDSGFFFVKKSSLKLRELGVYRSWGFAYGWAARPLSGIFVDGGTTASHGDNFG